MAAQPRLQSCLATLIALLALLVAADRLRPRAEAKAALLDEEEEERAEPQIPGELKRTLSFGFTSLAADVAFIQAIQVFWSNSPKLPEPRRRELDRRLAQLLDHSLTLDPEFCGGYRFAGSALPRTTADGKVAGVIAAETLTARGAELCPRDWFIPFQLGFLRLYYLDNLAGAAEAMRTASHRPERPPYVPALAARLAAEGAGISVARMMAEQLLEEAQQAGDESATQQLQQRLLDIQTDEILRQLQSAVSRFRSQRGRPPARLEELLRAGLLTAIPSEPRGGSFSIDPTGKVKSNRFRERPIRGDRQAQAGMEVLP